MLPAACGGKGATSATAERASVPATATSTSKQPRSTSMAGVSTTKATVAATTTTAAAPTTPTTKAPPTTPVATLAPTTLPPTTEPPRLSISGAVTFLDRSGVEFEGNTDFGGGPQPPADGSPCQGYGGYADLSAGASVIISDASGVPLQTTTLDGGATVREVRGTESERIQREQLLDSIYELRSIPVRNDAVGVAELNLERAQLRLADQQAGGLPGFEGHPFRATWCRVSFTASDLPLSDSYQFTVTHRGTTTLAADQIAADGNTVLLALG
jgi:hypothetical protein